MAATGTIQPGHDIFATPENGAFLASHPYEQLDASRQEKRLIQILPNSGNGFIECTLLQQRPLAEMEGHYAALSYCAGDLEKSDCILLNGLRFNVFAHLRHALREVRQLWKSRSDHSDCILWIDQISINQSDIPERSHQVSFMREIYQHAREVLVCLSTKKSSPRGMVWFLRLAEDVPPRDDDLPYIEDEKRILSQAQSACDDPPTRDHEDNEDESVSLDRYHWSRLKAHLWARITDEEFLQGWLRSYDIFEAPWWARAWVFQEFVVAADVRFMYSGKVATWEIIFPIWKSICPLHRHLLLNRNLFLELNDDYSLDSSADRNLCRVIERVERHHSQRAMDTVEFMIDQKLAWKGQMDLKELLLHSRYCNATDARDKVFAFIGLTDPAYGILPDYARPLGEVFTETTTRIIELEKSLEILCHAVASRPRKNRIMPSWVADWTCEEMSDYKRGNHYGSKFAQYLSGLPRGAADASFQMVETSVGSLNALQVRGICMDILTIELIDDFSTVEQRALFRCFECPTGLSANCYSTAQHGDELWILDGCRAPMVLRAESQHGHRLVCAAYVVVKDGREKNSPMAAFVERVERKKVQLGGWTRVLLVQIAAQHRRCAGSSRTEV